MSKFKVGDKIIGNDAADHKYGITRKGYIGTVSRIISENEVRLESGFYVDPKCFELVKSEVANAYELHITCNDGKTTNAVYKVNGKIEKRTEAVCAPSDTFNFNAGAELAINRVLYGTDYNPKDVAFKPTQPIAPQEDKAKYKGGDKVKVLANTNFHCFKIGETVTLRGERLYNGASGKFYWSTGIDSGYVREQDIEPYAEPEQPKLTVTREMLVELGACTGGISTFDRLFPSSSGDLKDVCKQAEKCGHANYSSWLMTRKFHIEEMQNEQPKEAIKLYCVKDYVGAVRKYTTKGEVVEIKNGYITLNGKSYGGYSSFKDFARTNKPIADCLVPLVKRPCKNEEFVLITATESQHDPKLINGDIQKVVAVFGDYYFETDKGNVFYPYEKNEYLVLDNYHPEPEKEPEPVYFSGKVVCVSDDNMYHTQGKAYTFIDGAVNTDKYGTYNPSNLAKTLEEFNKRNVPKFIPYLGEA